MKNLLSILIICLVCILGIKGVCASRTFTPHDVTVVKASHILVPTEEEAKAIKVMLDEGEDFAVLARQYSQCPSKAAGGDLGYFKRGQMVKAFEEVAFELPVNTVSDPVKTQFGWHLIKVTDRR